MCVWGTYLFPFANSAFSFLSLGTKACTLFSLPQQRTLNLTGAQQCAFLNWLEVTRGVSARSRKMACWGRQSHSPEIHSAVSHPQLLPEPRESRMLLHTLCLWKGLRRLVSRLLHLLQRFTVPPARTSTKLSPRKASRHVSGC